MNIWMVIYIAGVLQGSAGPLPYGILQCKMRAEQQEQEWDAVWKTHKLDIDPRMIGPDGKHLVRADYKADCVEQQDRPE